MPDRVIGAIARLERVGVPLAFALLTGRTLLLSLVGGWFGLDVRIYRAAASAMLAGQDPWLATTDGLRFAGPPPTLLLYIPSALLPETAAIALYTGFGIVAAVAVARALRMPAWWLLFTPLAESVILGNPDVLAIAILVCGGRFSGFAIAVKAYAAVPLLFGGRVGAVVVGVAVCAITLPLWPMFLAHAADVTATLAGQAHGGLSAWGTVLLVPAALAIFALRRRGAEWLAVPALWPYTQLHYAAIALPALRQRPVLAVALCLGYPLVAPVAIIAQATWESWRDRHTTATSMTATSLVWHRSDCSSN